MCLAVSNEIKQNPRMTTSSWLLHLCYFCMRNLKSVNLSFRAEIIANFHPLTRNSKYLAQHFKVLIESSECTTIAWCHILLTTMRHVKIVCSLLHDFDQSSKWNKMRKWNIKTLRNPICWTSHEITPFSFCWFRITCVFSILKLHEDPQQWRSIFVVFLMQKVELEFKVKFLH